MAADRGVTGYTVIEGTLELRQAISNDIMLVFFSCSKHKFIEVVNVKSIIAGGVRRPGITLRMRLLLQVAPNRR